jgi:heme-degrading monooxygenase HmoA
VRVGQYVAVSELSVPPAGRDAVEAAFGRRLGAVDTWPGFRGLEVWRDIKDPGSLIMISYWDSQAEFTSYMQSSDHESSHARIPSGDNRPRPVRFRRFEVIAQ